MTKELQNNGVDMGLPGGVKRSNAERTQFVQPKRGAISIIKPPVDSLTVSPSKNPLNGKLHISEPLLKSGVSLLGSGGADSTALPSTSHLSFNLPKKSSSAISMLAYKGPNVQEHIILQDFQVKEHEKSSQEANSTESRWKPDIYINSFVPRAFTAINYSSAVPIASIGVEIIDFAEYTKNFAGVYFIPDMKALAYQPTHSDGRVGASFRLLDIDNYTDYFMDSLFLDLEAQNSRIHSHDLFGVPLIVNEASQYIFTLHVPGLREGTPIVSYGDKVMLRQLRLDPVTKVPMYMAHWMLPGGGYNQGTPAPGFTGYQLNAIVMAVDRSAENITLRVNGVLPEPLVFNVCFGVQVRDIQSMQRALMRVDHELALARSTSISSRSTEHHGISIAMDTNTFAKGEVNNWLRCMLFPVEADGIWQDTPPSGTFKQKFIDQSLNYEQKKAIDSIQSKNYGCIPFLIHGPPGTGKTKTICEAVRQFFVDATFRGAVLLCAPSDPAADTLALRLKAQFNQTEMFRLNDYKRTFAEVPQELLSYCYIERGIFSLPHFPTLMKYKVVVTTCYAADILVQARITNRDLVFLETNMKNILNPYFAQDISPVSLHWAALLVDEAAQATEPELLIPVSVIIPPASHVVSPLFAMAGDHHQLSPRTYNKTTSLHISLFERLSALPVYASHPLSRQNAQRTTLFRPMFRPAFANLTRNYRSHPSILAMPSRLFYNDTLIPEATDIDSLLTWSAWRGRRWPLLFGCNGGIDACEDVQAAGGGGWYNLREATKAITYAADVLSLGLVAAQPDICIMAPFDTQVRLLRNMARARGLFGVNIGPVEAFQGLESRMVIFCTTRTRMRFVNADTARNVGVMSEPKKFNVGITRARQGLIVLGNPWVLGADRCWAQFLGFCWRNGLWEGEGEGEDLHDPIEGEEGRVNEWVPEAESGAEGGLRGIEKALVYRDKGDEGEGSKAARRFLGESIENRMWRMGLEAEAQVVHEDEA